MSHANEINEKTKVPLIWVVGIVTACVVGGIWAYQLKRDVGDIKNILQSNLTREEMREWARELERKNPGLIVPEIPRSGVAVRKDISTHRELIAENKNKKQK